MPTIKNKVLASIKTLMDLQNEKGLKKYGQSLDDAPYEKYDWKIMIIEELIDALQYQQKEMMGIEQNRLVDLDGLDVLTDLIVDWGIERDIHNVDPTKQF